MIHSADSLVSLWGDRWLKDQPGYKVTWNLRFGLDYSSLYRWGFQRYLFNCMSYPNNEAEESHRHSSQRHSFIESGSYFTSSLVFNSHLTPILSWINHSVHVSFILL